MKEKILVVDDEQAVRALLEKFLIIKGYTPLLAANGEEAIEIVKKDNPAVVLMDIRMPGMDGLTAVKKIQEINEKIGIIMITAVQSDIVGQESFKIGAFDYVTKPFDLEYLEKALMVKIAILVK